MTRPKIYRIVQISRSSRSKESFFSLHALQRLRGGCRQLEEVTGSCRRQEEAAAQQLRTFPNHPNQLPFSRNSQFPRCAHRNSFVVAVGSCRKVEEAGESCSTTNSNAFLIVQISFNTIERIIFIVVRIATASWWL
jgi:hypothetical protein